MATYNAGSNISSINSLYTNNSGNLNSKIRVVGAGNTSVTINGKLVVLCEQISDNPPRITANTAVVQGIGDQRPVAIIPGNVQGEGTLTLQFWERYPNAKEGFVFWQQVLKDCGVTGIENIYSIAALMGYQRTNADFLNNFKVQMFLENPTYDYGTGGVVRAADQFIVKEFMNPVITNVTGNETVNNTTVIKTGTIEIKYTHVQWGGQPSDLSVVSTTAM